MSSHVLQAPSCHVTFCTPCTRLAWLPSRPRGACASRLSTLPVLPTAPIRPVYALAGKRKTTKKRRKGFGEPNPSITDASGTPLATPVHPDVNNPSPDVEETRPLVDPERFVPRGPTMREAYRDMGRLEDDELGPDAGVLPQVVADRMIRRIATFAGVPLATLFVFFIGYFVAKYKYDITVIPVLVAYTTLGCIGAAGMGITYGIMSSSWDEDVDGTALGWKEASRNVMLARDGLTGMLAKERAEDEREKILASKKRVEKKHSGNRNK